MNKKKIDVVRHALVLFREKGIMQTSIQDIIVRSGISKGTFYNYFKSKNECVYDAIEYVRYEACLIRSEIQLGKPSHDKDVLIEQMVKKSNMNQIYGLPSIFEEMVHSVDKELHEYVMLYRLHELEWFSNRVIDVYGEEVRAYAFEVSILFNGMLHHLKFIKQHLEPVFLEEELRKILTTMFMHIDPIIDNMVNKQAAVLEQKQIEQLRTPIKDSEVKLENLLVAIEQFKVLSQVTFHQCDLVEAVVAELQRAELRTAVLTALLPAFVNSYKSTAFYDDARHIYTKIWLYINQK